MVQEKVNNNIERIKKIKQMLHQGAIDYDTAKILSKPIIDEMNAKVVEVARKYNKRPYKFTFEGLMR